MKFDIKINISRKNYELELNELKLLETPEKNKIAETINSFCLKTKKEMSSGENYIQIDVFANSSDKKIKIAATSFCYKIDEITDSVAKSMDGIHAATLQEILSIKRQSIRGIITRAINEIKRIISIFKESV